MADWISITSFKDIRRMTLINDSLYLVTSGGLLALPDRSSPGREILNTNGLGTTDVFDIIQDAAGQSWVAGHGRLVRFDDESSRQFLFVDRDDKLIPVYRVVDDSTVLWVGTDIGLVLFDKQADGGQIQDSYEFFGSLNPESAVFDILLTKDSIWVATSNGLAVADRTVPVLLNSPSAWKSFPFDSSYLALKSDTILSIVSFQSRIYAATPRAVVEVRMGADQVVGIDVAPGLNFPLSRSFLKVENDSLFYYYYNDSLGGGMGIISDTTAIAILDTGLVPKPISGINFKGDRWIVSGAGGLYENSSGSFVQYPLPGLPDNEVADFAINSAGRAIVGTRTGGAALRSGRNWSRLPTFRQGMTQLVVDSSDNIWIGTEGGGAWLSSEQGMVNYDEHNSPMLGNTDNPPSGLAFVVVRSLATDGSFIYATCYRAANGYPVVIGDLSRLNDPAGWDSLGVGDGITSDLIVSIDVYGSLVAVASEAVGVFLCDLGELIFDHSDDSCIHYTTDNGFLMSNSVRVVKFSPDGVLWVGTNTGLSQWDAGLEHFVDVELPSGVGSDVTTLEFEGRGGLWIGTTNGLAFLSSFSGQFETFTTGNSAILSDKINNLFWDQFTGDLYASTAAGLSIVPSRIGRPTSDIKRIVAFPNPYIIRSDGDILNFNYARSGEVRIFTVAGDLVKQFPIGPWDGRNQVGREVVSGVYFFVVLDNGGESGNGKFLLIREQ